MIFRKHRMLKAKKKEDKFIIMILENEAGETQRLELKFNSAMQKLKAVKKYISIGRKGFTRIQSIEGNSDHVASMKKLIEGYQPGDPIPVKRMMKETGAHVLPKKLTKLFTKEEIEESKSG